MRRAMYDVSEVKGKGEGETDPLAPRADGWSVVESDPAGVVTLAFECEDGGGDVVLCLEETVRVKMDGWELRLALLNQRSPNPGPEWMAARYWVDVNADGDVVRWELA